MTAPTAEQLVREADDLETAMLDGREAADLARVDAIRNQSRLARFRAEAAERKAERERQGARMASLAKLHADIGTTAAAFQPGPLLAELEAVREHAARFLALAAAHDAVVAALVTRARDLGCGIPAPGGPKAADGHIARAGNDSAVIASGLVLREFGESVAGLPAAAASGQPAPLPGVTESRRERPRPAHVVFSPRGGAITSADSMTPALADQIRKGDVVALDDTAISAWMAGTFDLESELNRMNGGGK